ncbi:unnamed protein product [Amoebophrya sp. A120]|nr:unnamed protein product [Amoebophrya sp. A120]|eukprot:GSA120T00019816001.1
MSVQKLHKYFRTPLQVIQVRVQLELFMSYNLTTLTSFSRGG